MGYPFMKVFSCGLAALAVAAPALAQDADEPITIVITGSRSEQPLAHATADTTVLDRSDIERTQAATLPGLLGGLNGIDVGNSGGAGKATSLYLRGANAGQTLLLLDGLRLGSATLGQPAWQNLPTVLLGRVEVVRGAQSGLYGSDAIGGVVQAFTREEDGPIAPWARAALGTQQGREAAVGFGGRDGATQISAGLSTFDTAGFDATSAENINHNSDRDGYRNLAGSLRLKHEFAPGQSLGLTALRTQGENEYDGYPAALDASGKYAQQALALNADNRINEVWRMRTTLGQSRDQSEDFSGDVSTGAFNTHRDQFTWQNDLSFIKNNTLSLGVEWLRERVDGSGVQAFTRDERITRSLFAVDTLRLGAHDLQLSLRRDDIEAIDTRTTGRLGWGWSLPGSLRLTASYATGFKAPTFNDLYYPESPWSAGNPNLKPEESRGWDLGLSQQLGAFGWRLATFRTDVDNLIQWTADESWRYTPDNVAEARLRGVEFGADYRADGWRVALAADWLQAEDRNTGDALPNRPDRSARLDVDRDLGRWSAGATLLAARYPDELPQAGYGVLNLRAAYRIDHAWSLSARIDNAFDRDYQTVSGYPMPGREAWLAVEYGLR